MLTNPLLSLRLKVAGAPQDSTYTHKIQNRDGTYDKVSAYDEQYLMRRIPMTLQVDETRLAFDFVRFAVADKILFSATYRRIDATLETRHGIIASADHFETFVDSLGGIYLWLLTKTTAFGQPKIAETKPETTTAGETKMDVSEDGKSATLTDSLEETPDVDTAGDSDDID